MIIKSKVLLVFFFCIGISFHYAQLPLDSDLEKCLAKDESTAGQRNCLIEFQKKWDQELNKNYQLLIKKLPKNAQLTLKESQIQWIKYRDKDFEWIQQLYFEVKEGSMFYVIADNKKLDIIKTRALELEEYLLQLDY